MCTVKYSILITLNYSEWKLLFRSYLRLAVSVIPARPPAVLEETR